MSIFAVEQIFRLISIRILVMYCNMNEWLIHTELGINSMQDDIITSSICSSQGSMLTADYGAITDREILPIEKVSFGGQSGDGVGTVKVTDITCAPMPSGMYCQGH